MNTGAFEFIPVACAVFEVFFVIKSLLSYDRIINHEYENHNEAWVKNGKPFKLFGGDPANKRTFQPLPFALSPRYLQEMQKRRSFYYFKWLFSAPDWAKGDEEALKLFSLMRRSLVFGILAFLLFFCSSVLFMH